jgi:hypothetical protein
LDVELLISSEPGVLAEVAEPVRLKAAPGERIVHTETLPDPGTPLRFAVRTIAGGKRSAPSPESLLLVKPPPPPPTDVSVRLTSEGLLLTWTECVATTQEPALPAAAEAEVEPGAGELDQTPAGASASESPRVGAPDPSGRPRAEPERPRSGEGARPARETTAPPQDPASGVAPAGPEPVTGPRQQATSDTEGQSDSTAATSQEAAAAAPARPPAPSPGIRIYRSSGDDRVPLLPSPLATETHLDAGLEHGFEYCYTLRTALTGAPAVEGTDSAEVCATFLDQQPPPAPEGLSALRRDAAVELAWSPLGEDAERPATLRVSRSQGGGSPEVVAELDGEATRWTDPEPPAGVVLEYALTAADAVGNESPPSEPARLIPR